MKIVLEGPVFHGQEDENIFFGCIYNIPGFKTVTGIGKNLHIEFESEVSPEASEQIQVLCERWNTKRLDV